MVTKVSNARSMTYSFESENAIAAIRYIVNDVDESVGLQGGHARKGRVCQFKARKSSTLS